MLDLEEMVRQYKMAPDEDQLNTILLKMEPLIKYWCQSQCHLAWEKEDMMQVARIAVFEALKRFDPDKGVRFKTFAYRTVSGKFMNYYRDHTWNVSVPRKYRELSVGLRKAENEYYKEHGKEAQDWELAEMLGVDTRDVKETMEAKRTTQMVSLDSSADDEDGMNLLNVLGEVDGGLGQVEFNEDLRDAMEDLNEMEQQVIYYRYVEDYTQKKIADMLGVSQMKVSRTEKAALAKIKEKLTEQN